MDLQHFEQAILKLAFETDARITTAAVAYYLGIPSREANRLLNALLEEGVLELDSDSSGNLYYRVPHHAADGDGTIKELRAKKDAATAKVAEPAPPPRPATPSPAYFTASPDDGGSNAAAYSPVVSSVGRVDEPAVSGPRPQYTQPAWTPPRKNESNRDNWGGFDDYYGDVGTGLDGSAAGGTQKTGYRVKPNWTSVSAKIASPDASLDRCGSSPVVVGTQVRCEPKPLPSSKPMIVSCADSSASFDAGREQLWFGRPAESTALVEVGETALARDYYIEQPEHQPGMALLLSLILCGTGQIYNGEVSKGIMMMILCFLLWFVLLGWVVHIWSIVDAVVVAERLNRKQA